MGYGYYGHGSWFLIVLVLAGFAMRAVAVRRRRAAGGGTASRSFTGGRSAGGPPATGTGPGTFTEPGTFTGIAPGWLKDPSGRHEQRYWSGTEWTEHVSDGGVPGVDPPPKK